MKKVNKNKIKVQFIKDYGETEKGVCKFIPISLAEELKKDKIVKWVQVYDPSRDLEQEDAISKLFDRVEALEKANKDLILKIEALEKSKK